MNCQDNNNERENSEIVNSEENMPNNSENLQNGNESLHDSEEVPSKETDAPSEKAPFCLVKELYEWFETFVFALVAVILLFAFVFRIVSVDGPSMQKTLHDNDRLFITNLTNKPKTGDIIVFQVDSEVEPLIKRVIATEGQTVDIDFNTWTVTVDGKVLDEPYVNHVIGNMNGYSDRFPLVVDKGKIFVMGDNRNSSLDSRYERIGQIDERNVLGKVLFRIFPFNKLGKVKPVTE